MHKPQATCVPKHLPTYQVQKSNSRIGNILMISEGRSGSDNVFTLRDGSFLFMLNPQEVFSLQAQELTQIDAGILRMELGKEIYERTGLTGKVFRSGGRKHAKERYCMSNCN
jgi:ribonuclease P/MRP protein subunit RPP40